MEEIIIPDSILDAFRCSLCKGYLSSPPVQVLSNGNSICSLCSCTTEQLTYRELTFETFLSNLSFPCNFKQYGCKERFQFGEANEHEEYCLHRSFFCPLMNNKNCAWEGLGVEMFDHFRRHHSDLTKKEAEFELQLNKDQFGIFLFVYQDVPFIIKFNYHADTCSLQYDIRYFINNIEKALCGFHLTNVDDCNCNISLKGEACIPYNINFYDVKYSNMLVLNNYMQVLDNPSSVKVTINPFLMKKQNNFEEYIRINHDLLQTLRCKQCRGYLIPPIFDSPKGVVCIFCHEKYGNTKPLANNNNKLIESVANAIFPCNWPNCTVIGKSETFKQHVLSCLHRIFKCLNCKISFTRKTAMNHLKYHGYKYFTDTIIYKMAFNKHFSTKNMFKF